MGSPTIGTKRRPKLATNGTRSTKRKGTAMSKTVVSVDTKSVGPGPLDTLLPGPSVSATVTWSDGSKSTGAGDSKSEATSNATKR